MTSKVGSTSKTSRRLGYAADGARAAITALKDSTDAFPPLKSTAAGIIVLWDTVEQFKSNKIEWNNLANLVTERVASIAEHAGTNPSPKLASTIENLNKTLSRILEDIKPLQNRNRLVRTLQVQADKQKILSFYERMKTALDSFNLIANITTLRVAENPIPETEVMSLDINRTPPPPPVHFYGRDAYVKRVVELISGGVEKKSGVRLAIRGPGGMGKTALALAVFHSENVQSLFGPRRHFVHCEAADTALLLLSAIGSSLRIDLSGGDALESVIGNLKSLSAPLFLILDNAETFWYSTQQAQVRTILQHISAISRVTLVLTMRGTELPNVASWSSLEPLTVLTREAARNAFLSIASDQRASDSLDQLLKAVDYIPLAITLLARISQAGDENPNTLHERWLVERTSLLQLGSHSPENSVVVSIKLSLHSQPMKDNPVALLLLSIISYLPDGLPTTHQAEITGLELGDVCAAAHTLKRLSLAHQSTDGHLTTLSPIREYMRMDHNLQLSNLEGLSLWYFELANLGYSAPGEPEFLMAIDHLTPESGNLSYVLSSCILSASISDELVESILGYSNFLYWTIPNGDLLQQLLQNPEEVPGAVKGKIKQKLGDILFKQDDYEAGCAALEEARAEFQSVGDRLGAAQCLQSLGNIMRMQDYCDGGRAALEEARAEFQCVGSRLGAAQCLRSLGDIMQMQDDYDGGRAALEEARAEFQSVGDRLGAAQCLQSLGDIMRMQDDYDGGRAALEEARAELQSVGDRLGAAQCLQSLGDIMRMQDDYDGGSAALEEARAEFQSVGSRLGAAQCLQSLGDIMQMQDDYDGGRAALKEARAEFQSVGDRLGAAQCLQSLGNIMQMQDDYDGGRAALEEARAEFQSVGTRLGAAQCLQSLGNIMRMQDDYDGGSAALEEARAEFQSVGDRLGAAQCLQSLGNTMRMQDDYDGGSAALEEARAEFQSVGSRLGAAQCLRSLGDIMQIQDDYDGGRAALEEARAEFQSVGSRHGAAQCLQSLGDIMQMQDDYDGGSAALEEARAEFQSVGSHLGAAQCLRSLGNIMWMQDDYDSSSVALEEARAEFESIGHHRGVVQCVEILDAMGVS